nr:uncharacterized protein LOC117986676 [Maniola hyperantus]
MDATKIDLILYMLRPLTIIENLFGRFRYRKVGLLDIVSVGIMAYTCEVLLLKRNSTKILVNELIMNYDLTRQMRLQAKAFMELIEVWPLQIYAYDMFAIDIKLMLKFISVSTTYLIVIIQVSHFY